MSQDTKYYPLQGGLDLTTPRVSANPGSVIDASNFEAAPLGYQRIAGFERFDGKPSPNFYQPADLSFTGAFDTTQTISVSSCGVTEILPGMTIVGATSGSTVVVKSVTVLSGTWGSSDVAAYLVTTTPESPLGNLVAGEVINDSAGTPLCTTVGTIVTNPTTDPVNTPTNTAPWSYYTIPFTAGLLAPTTNQFFYGASSGATGIAKDIELSSGSWAADDVEGVILVDDWTGNPVTTVANHYVTANPVTTNYKYAMTWGYSYTSSSGAPPSKEVRCDGFLTSYLTGAGTATSTSPSQIGSNYDDITKVVTAGGCNRIALRSNGTLLAMGVEPASLSPIDYGGPIEPAWTPPNRKVVNPLNIGDSISTPHWHNFASKTDTYLDIGANRYHIALVKADGTLWSSNPTYTTTADYGRPDSHVGISPVQVGALTTWASVTCGTFSTHAVKNDGTLWGWGLNVYGQLGDGTVVDKTSPVQIGALTTWSNVVSDAYTTVALKTDGTLWAWGYNAKGQIGDGTVVDRSSPVQIGALTTWAGVDTQSRVVLARTTGGTMFSWGDGTYGTLGTTSTVNRSSPVQIGALATWAKVALSGFVAAAVSSDGKLYTWGRGSAVGVGERLGDGATANRSSPVQIGSRVDWINIFGGHALTGMVSGSTTTQNPDTVFTTSSTTTGDFIAGEELLYEAGLMVQGSNTSGELGDGTTTTRTSPVQIGDATTEWLFLASNGSTTVAVRGDGTLHAWGDNTYGQLGDGTVVSRSSPVQIGTGVTWARCSTSGHHTVALKEDGTMWACGYNAAGQLGKNDTTNRSVLVQVGSGSWVDVAAGGDANGCTLGVSTTGALYSCGHGADGRLGNGSTSTSVLTQVGSRTDWASVASDRGSYGIRTTGELFAWGLNSSYAVLGLGDYDTRYSPVQVGSLSWAHVYAGSTSAAGITTDGTAYVWGTPGGTTPSVRATGTSWVMLSGESVNGGGYEGPFGIRADGTLWNINGLSDTKTQVGTATNWQFVCGGGTAFRATIKTKLGTCLGPAVSRGAVTKTQDAEWMAQP